MAVADFSGSSVLITGAASGIGAELCRQFVAGGARVVAFDRSQSGLASLKSELGDAITPVCGDVRSAADNDEAVAVAIRTHDKLDVFIGNAGIWDWNVSLLDLPADKIDATFDEVMHINVKGYLLGARSAATALRKSGGNMIFTLSNASLYTEGGGPIYTASKHAALGLVRQLAFELAPQIRVNGVAIGAMKSDLRGPEALGMQDQSIGSVPLEAGAPHFIPVARLITPAEYAGTYLWLAGDGAEPVTGAVVEAHGGVGIRGITKPYMNYNAEQGTT